MGFARFAIDLDASGHGKILVNDQDVAKHVRALTFRTHGLGETPRLTLELAGECRIDGEGIVEVVRDVDEADVRRAVGNWLAQIDPEELDSLASGNASMADSPAEALLMALRTLAAG